MRQSQIGGRRQRCAQYQGVGLGDQKVADVDRIGYAELAPKRLAIAAHGVPVLDVIVNEEKVVKNLRGQGERQCLLGIPAQRFAGHEAERRPQTLAAAGELVPYAVRNVGVLSGRYRRRKQLFDAARMTTQEFQNIQHGASIVDTERPLSTRQPIS